VAKACKDILQSTFQKCFANCGFDKDELLEIEAEQEIIPPAVKEVCMDALGVPFKSHM
jgi:hypothetical protein